MHLSIVTRIGRPPGMVRDCCVIVSFLVTHMSVNVTKRYVKKLNYMCVLDGHFTSFRQKVRVLYRQCYFLIILGAS